MDGDKEAVLAALTQYFKSLSNTPPPLTAARAMVIGEATRVIRPGGGMAPSFYTMSQTLDILEDRIRETPGIAEKFADPEPEVWVHDNLAFVWTGSEQSVGGTGARRGVHVFSLLRHHPDLQEQEQQQEAGWKIAGVTTVARQITEPLPPIIRDAEAEIAVAAAEPVRGLLAAFSRQDWDAFAAVLHPDMGATLWRGSWPPLIVSVDSLIERLKAVVATFPASAAFSEDIHDVEVRVCGDLAVVWAPFVVVVGGS
ncbi:uncharacterized protein B0I36DRAFT_389285 [Microdochium trichocladiopsis]|uniref:SnoaL-like domain-containing protein n=1 Tax=Microdochium trichocladiopsis TaxID=1682393 RepID=A0A9P9BJ82_9PEZI|nr:uncharacterized protein B0I36DRAFT_389285 [Microdochium trichocladiopsis]KAH7014371.1 hypothetical protein B0I36DRAFT_389285 [Microdochium trichocladiopsis]